MTATVTETPTAEQWWPSRYGADDQAGALNEITPDALLRGVALVREGRVFDLAHVLHAGVPVFPRAHLPPVPDHARPPAQPAGARRRP